MFGTVTKDCTLVQVNMIVGRVTWLEYHEGGLHALISTVVVYEGHRYVKAKTIWNKIFSILEHKIYNRDTWPSFRTKMHLVNETSCCKEQWTRGKTRTS